MTARHRTLQVYRTAHLHQLGTLSAQTRHVWLVCHGYGQLAKYFLRHFEPLVDDVTAVLAPEALSKFYLNGFNGRVGATWMTKEERLSEITDYVNYLNQVHQLIFSEAPQAQLHVLGFSQGAATVCRWLDQLPMPAAELVLWAGIFPPDLELTTASPAFSQTKFTYVYGLQDEFVAEAQVAQQLQRVTDIGLLPRVLTFEGKHEINRHVLLQLKSS